MEGYLLDTCAVSAYLSPTRPNHAIVRDRIDTLEAESLKYVSVITLGELVYGAQLSANSEGVDIASFEDLIMEARKYPLLSVTDHVADSFGKLKASLAVTCIPRRLKRKKRPRWVEDWIKAATGRDMQVDENDLWLFAQAHDRDLVFLTTDSDIERINQLLGSPARVDLIR
jgi:predicted nucleic acid-binding protein